VSIRYQADNDLNQRIVAATQGPANRETS